MRVHQIEAVSLPIVYTVDGDHDPNGLLFVPTPFVPLVDWVRQQWEHGNRRLPRLHQRRQRAQIVVDAFDRLEPTLERLRHGGDDDLALLAELIGRESVREYGQADDRLSHGTRRPSGRAGARRLNVITLLNELRSALSDLGDSDGLPDWRPAPPDETVPEPIEQPGEPLDRLVTLSREQRARWRAHWAVQLGELDDAIETWFTEAERPDSPRHLDRLIDAHPELDPDRIRRLLLNDHRADATRLGQHAGPYDRFNPLKPIPLVQPLVLRAHVGTPIQVEVTNSIRGRRVGFHCQGTGLGGGSGRGVDAGDGSYSGDNDDSTIGYGCRRVYTYACDHEGAWPINDLADVRGSEEGSNTHGLFGVLIVEPAGVRWHDPQTGDDLTDDVGPGLYADIIAGDVPADYVDLHSLDKPCSHREFTVFLHDEPEIHSGLHGAGEHTVMPISYRAEPMPNRLPHRMRRYAERTARHEPAGQVGVDRRAVEWRLGDELDEQFWTARTPDGDYLERVAGEEQHHSSWLFGDPLTPVLRAYAGDPCRVRLVHAGVKETHVFHLHVHQWRAVPADVAPPGVHGHAPDDAPRPKGSQLLDSITIGPQTAVTIDPLYGSGSRQHAFGDIIWHCHLYPHFHHGMWGLWRSFDRLVDGTRNLPDGTPCPALAPLPGRTPPAAEHDLPGFPWFIDGDFPMKSPPPPAVDAARRGGRRLLLGQPAHSPSEWQAMADGCRDGSRPGALFVDLDAHAADWNTAAGLPPPRIVSYDVEVRADPVAYNADGWHDRRGHHYRLLAASVKQPAPDGSWQQETAEVFEARPGANPEPFFPRANHGDIVELRLHNALGEFGADEFDVGQLPVECGLHVHLVKFDVLAADGSSTGWNYLSGASCRQAVGSDHPGQQRTVGLHRWVVDEEFGPCFFHDHLLANYRQKHGLFAALIAEPHGSQWHSPDQTATAWAEPAAVIVPPTSSGVPPFREACLAIADFVPLLDEGGRALNPPTTLSGDDDPGGMAVNYRCAPLTHRGDDPSRWFSVTARSRPNLAGVPGEPDTPLIETYPGERLRIRLIQGSHEEQHSFRLNGIRWRRDWGNPRSLLTDQQSLGISEAFTLDVDPADASPYGPGDHLWSFGGLDDLWLGCWGYLRVRRPGEATVNRLPPLPDLTGATGQRARLAATRAVPPRGRRDDGSPAPVRTYLLAARRTEHLYTGTVLTDPWGLHYVPCRYRPEDESSARGAGRWPTTTAMTAAAEPDRPLVLRAHRGEWVRVILVNELVEGIGEGVDAEAEVDERRLPRFGVEPSPARLPLEHLDEFGRPDSRTVSDRVSLHACLLRFDVADDDGSFVGRNPDSTVAALRGDDDAGHGAHEAGQVVRRHTHHGPEQNWAEYWWYADEQLAPATHRDGPGQVALLHDVADLRNHRHHGLIGALVVLPGDVRPYRRGSTADEPDGYLATTVELRTAPADGAASDQPGAVADADGATGEAAGATGGLAEQVVAEETVLFVQDGLRFFVNGHPDQPVPDIVLGDDPEDSGQKAISYVSAPVHRGRPPRGAAAPVLAEVTAGRPLWLRALGATDKPRQHTLTVHDGAWHDAPWVPGSDLTGGVSGVTGGWARDLVLTLPTPGDHVVRTGSFRWGTEGGVWTTLRAE